MSAKSEEERLKEARGLATSAIKIARKEQNRLWKFLEIDVHVADREVNGRENRLIWAKIDELAHAKAYPLWMDAILITMTALVPVNAILVGIAAKLARSRKLLALTKLLAQKTEKTREVYLQDAKQLKAIMRTTQGLESPMLKPQSKAWLQMGTILQPEATAGLRTLIRLGAQAKVQPLYNKDVVVDAKKAPQADGTGLPAAEVFGRMLQWIEVSRSNDEEILESLEESVALSRDEEWLKSVPEYLEADERRATRNAKTLAEGPIEGFKRFVEACLWCTTYDFTPSFKPAHQGWKISLRKDIPPLNVGGWDPSAALFPFPESFWDNLVARHYDPYFQGGDKTYKEIGQIGYVAPEGSYYPPSPTAATLIETSRTFDPRTRLSMHWSGILAPALLRTNQEITDILNT